MVSVIVNDSEEGGKIMTVIHQNLDFFLQPDTKSGFAIGKRKGKKKKTYSSPKVLHTNKYFITK